MADLMREARAQRFTDRVVLVSGVGPGAGLATALRVAAEGAKVVAAARGPQHLEHAAELLKKHGADFRTVRADMGTEAGARSAVAEAVAAFGKLDALISMAGGYEGGGFDQCDQAALDRMLAVNLRPAFEASHAAVPELAKSGRGAIVITTAVFGAVIPGPGLLAYNVSKSAANGLVKSLAGELLAKNVRVNAVLPGGIRHEFDPALDPSANRPLKKGPALPQDVAAAAAFLASDDACWITGATLIVDGGFSVARPAF